MAVLDRFIDVLFDKKGTGLALETDRQIMLKTDGGKQAITKDPLATVKIVGLVREIMPEGMRPQLDRGDGRLAFGYFVQEHRVDAEVSRSGDKITVLLAPARQRRTTAAVSVPAEALLMQQPAAAAPPPPAAAEQADLAQADHRAGR